MTNSIAEANNFFIVAIGASAGGLQALESFFSNLPDHPNAAFVVVQHLSPDYRSMMTEILQRKTPMPVTLIEDGMEIEPGRVYSFTAKQGFTAKQALNCQKSSFWTAGVSRFL